MLFSWESQSQWLLFGVKLLVLSVKIKSLRRTGLGITKTKTKKTPNQMLYRQEQEVDWSLDGKANSRIDEHSRYSARSSCLSASVICTNA